MKTKSRCYKKSSKVVTREIEGEIILVPLKQDADEMESIYCLSGCAVDAWNMINGKNSFIAIENKIIDRYDVAAEKLRKDLEELFLKLENIEAII